MIQQTHYYETKFNETQLFGEKNGDEAAAAAATGQLLVEAKREPVVKRPRFKRKHSQFKKPDSESSQESSEEEDVANTFEKKPYNMSETAEYQFNNMGFKYNFYGNNDPQQQQIYPWMKDSRHQVINYSADGLSVNSSTADMNPQQVSPSKLVNNMFFSHKSDSIGSSTSPVTSNPGDSVLTSSSSTGIKSTSNIFVLF